MPRLLVALIGIAVIGVMCIGIRDYVKQQKDAKPSASTRTPTVVHSNRMIDPKKDTSAKTGRARMSASKANDPTTQLAVAADETEEPQDGDQFVKAGAKPTAAHDEIEAAKDRNNQACYYPPPLPNATKPADVDALYYYNWAREYCEFVGVEPERRLQ
jgi:hypothetical protein